MTPERGAQLQVKALIDKEATERDEGQAAYRIGAVELHLFHGIPFSSGRDRPRRRQVSRRR
jgi:hypothetical protein